MCVLYVLWQSDEVAAEMRAAEEAGGEASASAAEGDGSSGSSSEEGKAASVLMAPRTPFVGALWRTRKAADDAYLALLALEEADESMR